MDTSAEWLREKYWVEGLSTPQIAEIVGVTMSTICNRMEKYGIRRRTLREAHPRGEKSPSWKGGRFIDGRGYVWIYMPDHPRARKKGYILEHRLVMGEILGRPLESWEKIHHINDIKDDNRSENLQVVTFKNHRGELACPQCGYVFNIQ